MAAQEDPAAKEALHRFAEAISDSQFRKAFWEHPDKALADNGVDVGDLPSEVLGFLKDLSLEELRLMARMDKMMLARGLHSRTREGKTLGHF